MRPSGFLFLARPSEDGSADGNYLDLSATLDEEELAECDHGRDKNVANEYCKYTLKPHKWVPDAHTDPKQRQFIASVKSYRYPELPWRIFDYYFEGAEECTMKFELEEAYSQLYLTHHGYDHHEAITNLRDLQEQYKLIWPLVSPWTKNLETHRQFGFGEYP